MVARKEKTRRNKFLVLKPVSTDINYEYVCTKCGCNHWISHREACAKNFRIICDCNIVIKPKRILDVKIVYVKSKKQNSRESSATLEKEEITTGEKSAEILDGVVDDTKPYIELDNHTLNEASRILIGYGYEENEADTLIRKAFDLYKQNDIAALVKLALKGFGENDD